MSRPLRIEYPGAVYHITSRGNEKKPVFKDDQDRENFLNTLQHVNKRYNWICHAYCLMTNHFHLVVQTPEANLSKGMQWLNGKYAGCLGRVSESNVVNVSSGGGIIPIFPLKEE